MALLNFDPAIGLTAPDTAEIRNMVAADWVNAFNTGDGSPQLDTEAVTPAGQCIDAETAYLAQVANNQLFLANMFNPLTSEGIWQDAIGYIYYLQRKTAQPTTATCVVTGLAGTQIPRGAIIQNAEGVQYECAETATIGSDGTASAVFQCVQSGAIDCAANSLTQIVTVIPGWDGVNNPASGVTGRNEESQVDFEARRYASVMKNARGSAAAVESSIAALPDVVACRVLENDTIESATKFGVTIPAHSIAICVYGGTGAEIAETIFLKKSGGTPTIGETTVSYTAVAFHNTEYTYNIIRPVETDVSLVVTIADDPSLPSNLEQIVKEAVISDFLGENQTTKNPRVSIAQTVYASRFGVAIIAAGIVTLQQVAIALGEGALGVGIDIPANKMPVISADDITVMVIDNMLGAQNG